MLHNLTWGRIYIRNNSEAEKKYNQKLKELSNANSAYEALFEKMMMLEEQLS